MISSCILTAMMSSSKVDAVATKPELEPNGSANGRNNGHLLYQFDPSIAVQQRSSTGLLCTTLKAGAGKTSKRLSVIRLGTKRKRARFFNHGKYRSVYKPVEQLLDYSESLQHDL